ncbi:LamG-like jellyroll fold domain-containing protein, partial [Thermoproteota archaeon]
MPFENFVEGGRHNISQEFAIYYLDTNADDATSNQLNGTITNAIIESDCIIGSCYHFNSSEQAYILIPHNESMDEDYLTITAWVKKEHDVGQQKFLSNDYWDSGHEGSWVVYYGEGQLKAYFKIEGYSYTLTSSFNSPVDEWEHVIATANGTHLSLYSNGRLADRLEQSGRVDNNNLAVCMGAACNETAAVQDYFDGLIDEVHLSGNAMDEVEAVEFYYDYFNNTKDYSQYMKYGIVENAVFNATAGIDGWGAYEFDGVDDQVNLSIFNLTEYNTVVMWINNGSWHHLADVSGTVYVDGVVASDDLPIYSDEIDTSIGKYNATSFFQGTIDEVMIYGRALSPEQVLVLSQNRTDIIVSQELSDMDEWQGCIIPYDAEDDGEERCSSILSVQAINYIPVVTKPVFNVSTLYTFQSLGANSTYTDANNDTGNVTFYWYVEGVNVHTQIFYDISNGTVLNSVIPDQYYVKNQRINVSVRAYDGQEWSLYNWSDILVVNNSPANVDSVFVNASGIHNRTTDNIFVNYTTSDIDSDNVTGIINWYRNGTSITVLNMPFEPDSDQNATDYSSFNNQGTVYGATHNLTGGYDDLGAYEFDGVDDYIVINPDNFNNADALSVSYWFNIAGDGGSSAVTDEQVLVSKTKNDSFIGWWFVYYESEDRFRAFMRTTGGVLSLYSNATDGSTIVENQWVHVGLVWNGTTLLLYVDGVLQDSGALTGSSNFGTRNVSIGGSTEFDIATYERWLNGSVDDLLVFNRSLSPEQILALYNNRTDLIVSNETIEGENWSACVTPNDGQHNGIMNCSANFTIGPPNTPPVMSLPVFNDTNLFTYEHVEANSTYTDADLHTGDVIFIWYVDGVYIYNQTYDDITNGTVLSSILARSNYDKNQVINVSVQAFDSEDYSGLNWSNMTVNNSRPTVDSIYVTASGTQNRTTDNLTVHVTTSDRDGDDVKNITNWYVDNTSITVLNMPFEPDGDQNATDYSSFNNHGTNYGATHNLSGGYDDLGAYEFDGISSYVNVSGFNVTQYATTLMWINNGSWYHIVNVSGTIYVNGAVDNAEFPIYYDGADTLIGRYNTTDLFQGIIDEVLIYNRALSPDQVLALYNNRTDLLVSNETLPGEGWKACVTPNDGQHNGLTDCSDNFSIAPANNPPKVTTPVFNDSNLYTDEFLGTNSTYTDADGHTGVVTFYWYVDGENVFNDTHPAVTTGSVLNSSLASSYFLKHEFINVSVRAFDGEDYSTYNWSATIEVNNSRPTVDSLVLNSSLGYNRSLENLTLHIESSDADSDNIKNITDWRLDGDSIAVLNMPFEADKDQNATDYSSFNNSGTNYGATWTSDGYIGGAYEFDGVDDYIDVGEVNFTEELTYELWVKINSYGTGAKIISKRTLGTNYFHFLGLISNRIYAGVGNGTTNTWTTSTSYTPSTGEWHHVAFTYKNSDKVARIYVDGIERISDTLDNELVAFNANITIGRDSDNAISYFNGTVDEVRIFNRSLTEQQILALYNNRTDLIVSQETSSGDDWSACVTPNDGEEDGNRTCTVNLSISSNIAPEVTKPIFNVSVLGYDRDVEATTTYTDGELDSGYVEFRWYVNGDNVYNYTTPLIPSGSSPVSVFTSGNYTVGDQVKVSAQANDGNLYSSVRWSDPLIVADITDPIVELISPTTGFITNYTNVSLTCNATDFNLSMMQLYTNISGGWTLNQTEYFAIPVGNWSKAFDSGQDDDASSITIPHIDSIYMIGRGENLATGTSSHDWWVKKFNSSGYEFTQS